MSIKAQGIGSEKVSMWCVGEAWWGTGERSISGVGDNRKSKGVLVRVSRVQGNKN